MTAVAPTTSTLRRASSPARVIPPGLALPAVEWSLGVRPSQAAKSRPDLNACGSGTFIASRLAPTGPMPGMASSRRDTSLPRCHACSLASAAASRSSSPASSPARPANTSRAIAGTPASAATAPSSLCANDDETNSLVQFRL